MSAEEFHVGQRVDIPRYGQHAKVVKLHDEYDCLSVEVIDGPCDGQTHYYPLSLARRELQPTRGLQ